MSVYNRTYGTLLTDTTAIYIPLLKMSDPKVFAVSADWTPAAGDVKISKDGGAAANIGTLPAFVTDKGWKFILSATELEAQNIQVRVVDAAVCSDGFTVETFGHPSAMYPDPDASNPVAANAVQVAGSSTVVDNIVDDYDGTGYAKTTSTIGLTSAERAAVADAVHDEVLSGHVAAGTAGALDQTPKGVAQAGGASTVTLAAGESATDDLYNGRLVKIVAGTGAGQTRIISDYVGATKVATVDLAWETTPDTTSRYAII